MLFGIKFGFIACIIILIAAVFGNDWARREVKSGGRCLLVLLKMAVAIVAVFLLLTLLLH